MSLYRYQRSDRNGFERPFHRYSSSAKETAALSAMIVSLPNGRGELVCHHHSSFIHRLLLVLLNPQLYGGYLLINICVDCNRAEWMDPGALLHGVSFIGIDDDSVFFGGGFAPTWPQKTPYRSFQKRQVGAGWIGRHKGLVDRLAERYYCKELTVTQRVICMVSGNDPGNA
jgi:hypothetical protein